MQITSLIPQNVRFTQETRPFCLIYTSSSQISKGKSMAFMIRGYTPAEEGDMFIETGTAKHISSSARSSTWNCCQLVQVDRENPPFPCPGNSADPIDSQNPYLYNSGRHTQNWNCLSFHMTDHQFFALYDASKKRYTITVTRFLQFHSSRRSSSHVSQDRGIP